MKTPSEKYDVGYGRPPAHTRWKKGKSGNPKRMRKRKRKSVIEMIDEFFAGEIKIVERGMPRKVTNFEAILMQLWLKSMANNKRAMKVLLRYRNFAASQQKQGEVEVQEIIEDSNSEGEEQR
jgi:uncharacterized protein DUF5681